MLNSLVGGQSSLEISRLNIQNLEQAKAFILTYGYDLDSEEDLKKLEKIPLSFRFRLGEVIVEGFKSPIKFHSTL